MFVFPCWLELVLLKGYSVCPFDWIGDPVFAIQPGELRFVLCWSLFHLQNPIGAFGIEILPFGFLLDVHAQIIYKVIRINLVFFPMSLLKFSPPPRGLRDTIGLAASRLHPAHSLPLHHHHRWWSCRLPPPPPANCGTAPPVKRRAGRSIESPCSFTLLARAPTDGSYWPLRSVVQEAQSDRWNDHSIDSTPANDLRSRTFHFRFSSFSSELIVFL